MKAAAGEEWYVDHGVWQVEEERLIFAAIDEGGGFIGVEPGEFCLILGRDGWVDDGVVFDQWEVWPAFQSLFHGQLPDFRVERPHIVAVGQSEVFVEAVLEWEEGGVVPEVPFAEAGGGVVFLSADFCECCFVGVDTDAALWSECSLDTDSDVVATGQEGCSRSGADGLGDIEIGEAAAASGEVSEVGCELGVTAKGGWVSVAHVVHENEDDIWSFFGCGEGGGVETGQCCEQQAGEFWQREWVSVVGRCSGHVLFFVEKGRGQVCCGCWIVSETAAGAMDWV